MPEKIQIGHRYTEEGELRLLLKEDGADRVFDFSLFEWLTLVSIMAAKVRDAMAEALGLPGPRPVPKQNPKTDILIAQNISPIRSRLKGDRDGR